MLFSLVADWEPPNSQISTPFQHMSGEYGTAELVKVRLATITDTLKQIST